MNLFNQDGSINQLIDPNIGMKEAAKINRKDLVDFFITKGANHWNMGMRGAAEGGHQALVDFFKQKLESSIQLIDYIGSETCSICQNETISDAQTPCSHIFHHSCITEWYRIQKTCPVCRRNL